MGLAAGIVGLPNVGKSTIFNALSNGKAAVENYPFCTIDPNHGIVAVPDQRLDKITALVPTKKVVPAFIELVDIAGLVKGASQGEGLGNQFLGHIKDVNAVIHVVRCFENDDIIHVEGSINPDRDVSTIETELMMADLTTVERACDRAAKAMRTGEKEAKIRLAAAEKAKDSLSRGLPLRISLEQADHAALYDLHLITAKPCLFVANVDEAGIGTDSGHVVALRELATRQKAECIKICGKIEAEISELPPEERDEFLHSLGMIEPGLALLTRAAYQLLGLETFFTAGPDENRAWTIRKGATAVEAAAEIHSDIAKGFIKADVYSLADLENFKTEVALRAAGKIRQEGREYVVADGDIMYFKFNV